MSSKLESLLKKFPCISTVLQNQLGCIDLTGVKYTLKVDVQTADQDLMYRQAKNNGDAMLDRKRCPGQVMMQTECVYALSSTGMVLNKLEWPSASDLILQPAETYTFHAMHTGFGAPTDAKNVGFLVWVKSCQWFTDRDPMSSPPDCYGDFVNHEVYLTVYRQPSGGGFSQLVERSSERVNLVLDSHLLLRGVQRKDIELVLIDGRLEELCQRVYDEVLDNGMLALLDAGLLGKKLEKFGPVAVNFTDCEHVEVYTGDDCWLSIYFDCNRSNKQAWRRGVGGRIPELRDMVARLVQYWADPQVREAYRKLV